MNENYIIRLISPNDSIEKVNAVLRSAYSALAEAGMKYAASHEDVEATRKNITVASEIFCPSLAS